MNTCVKGCVPLKNTPKTPKSVIEKYMVTDEEIIFALREIERRRIEDNKSPIRKLFERIFKMKGGEQ